MKPKHFELVGKDSVEKHQNKEEGVDEEEQSHLKKDDAHLKFPKFKGTCECEQPNAELYEFKGNMMVNK
jgi:hypothetical protein